MVSTVRAGVSEDPSLKVTSSPKASAGKPKKEKKKKDKKDRESKKKSKATDKAESLQTEEDNGRIIDNPGEPTMGVVSNLVLEPCRCAEVAPKEPPNPETVEDQVHDVTPPPSIVASPTIPPEQLKVAAIKVLQQDSRTNSPAPLSTPLLGRVKEAGSIPYWRRPNSMHVRSFPIPPSNALP